MSLYFCSSLINQGGLNKFNGQHALRERARKLDQGILIIRFGSCEMLPVSIYALTWHGDKKLKMGITRRLFRMDDCDVDVRVGVSRAGEFSELYGLMRLKGC
jgi:coiled-coil domain-containing protein 130